MNGVRHLSIEAGPECTRAHEWCPVTRMGPRVATMTPRRAAALVREALSLGFTGEVGFHYYNEPTLYPGFIRAVIAEVPEARYMLWTNGDLLTPGLAALCGRIIVTDYGDLGALPEHPNLGVLPCSPDARADIYDSPRIREAATCYRPSFEVPVDCEGRIHLCCEDWRGEVPIASLAEHSTWRQRLANGTTQPPDVCRRCTSPLSSMP
jgi:hypothetical protein